MTGGKSRPSAHDADWPRTVWVLIERAGKKSRAALQEVLTAYARPITVYAKRKLMGKGYSLEDVQDLVQSVLADVSTKDVLGRAHHSKGRFRCLMVAITRNKIYKLFRDHPKEDLSGEESSVTSLDVLDRGMVVHDEEFDTSWALGIIGRALERLREEKESEVGALYLFAFKGLDMKAVAEQLRISFDQVRNHIHRGRRKLVKTILDIIREEAPSESEFQEEARYLRQFFPKDVRGWLSDEALNELWMKSS